MAQVINVFRCQSTVWADGHTLHESVQPVEVGQSRHSSSSAITYSACHVEKEKAVTPAATMMRYSHRCGHTLASLFLLPFPRSSAEQHLLCSACLCYVVHLGHTSAPLLLLQHHVSMRFPVTAFATRTLAPLRSSPTHICTLIPAANAHVPAFLQQNSSFPSAPWLCCVVHPHVCALAEVRLEPLAACR